MTSQIDIANRALSKIGTQKTISSFTDPTPAATQCGLWYNAKRQALLRTAPWGFGRRQLALTQTGDAVPDNTAPYPWLYQYAYPSDCLKFRYVLAQPPTSTTTSAPNVSDTGLWGMRPSRSHRFLIANSFDAQNNASKTVLSNVSSAVGVYTYDATDPNQFDPLFVDALVDSLAAELVMALSGNVGLMQQCKASAEDKITKARVADGNEAIPKTDHTPDWIATRGAGSWLDAWGIDGMSAWGNHVCSYDDMSWSM